LRRKIRESKPCRLRSFLAMIYSKLSLSWFGYELT
jgi:hypothetical protein